MIVFVAAWLWLTKQPDQVYQPLPEKTLAPAAAVAAPAAAKPLKQVYRNSVIPGGVHSAAELAAAVQRDPVLAAHYADFNVAAARVQRVEQSRLVHVSYRIGDQIYWTKNKVRLAVGETLLSDGEHLVRGRCGNRIADEAQGMVLHNDPATEELEAMFIASDDVIEQNPNALADIGAANQGSANAQRNGSPTQTVPPAGDMSRNPNFPGSNPGQPGPGLFVNPPGFAPAPAAAPGSNPVGNVPNGTQPDPAGTPRDKPAPGGTPPGNPAPGGTPPGNPGPEGGQPPTPGTPGPNTPNPTPPNIPGPDPLAPFIPPPTFSPEPPVLTVPETAPEAVPEPGSIALFGLALIALVLVRRSERRSRRAVG